MWGLKLQPFLGFEIAYGTQQYLGYNATASLSEHVSSSPAASW